MKTFLGNLNPRAFGKVITKPNYVPINGTSGAVFSSGKFLVNTKGIYDIVLGVSTSVTVLEDTVAVVVNNLGVFSAVSEVTGKVCVVAWCRNGSIVEVVGSNNLSSVVRSTGKIKPILSLPDEYDLLPEVVPISVTQELDGTLVYSTTYDVTTKKATTGVTYYVDVATGSDAAAGTIGAPLKSINVAISKTPLADIIMVKYAAGDDYDRSYGWSSSITNRNLSIIGYGGGKPKLTTVDRFSTTWTLYSTGVYTLSRSQTGGIIDETVVDSYGRPQQLTSVASLAECQSTPSSFYFATPNVYIHLHDGRVPDSSVKVLLNQNNGRVVDNSIVYLENLEFGYSYRGFHGEVVTAGAINGRVFAKDCTFGMSLTENSFNSYGMSGLLQNCIAEYGNKDGFNVHSDRTGGIDIIPWFIEIECEGRYCGYDGNEFNNGSTYHDGVLGLRLNGNYHHTHGRTVNDVSEGTVSINIGCYSGDNTWSATSRSCWESGQASTGTTKMYCYSCRTPDPTDGSQTFVRQGTSELYLFDSPIGIRAQYYGGANPYTFIHV